MRCLLGSALLLIASAFYINAQTVDTAILGTVSDSGGAVVPKVAVTITQSTTGVSHATVSSDGGTYEVRYLVPGDYTVEVRANGFRSERRTGILIEIGQQARIDFTLQVGDVQQTVEVNTTTPLLQTESATIAGVVGSDRIESLPINGRRFEDLAVLTPGVQVYNPDLHSSSTDGAEIGGNGGRLIWGQVNVDGITMVNNRHNYVNLFPSIDAIEEFKVQTGNYSAEYGGNAGTNVNIQIKSGSNKFHGNLFEYIRNEALDARNYFAPAPAPKNILKQNQFGATFGGPLVHDKTFFFASYEGIRSINESPSTGIVLTAAQRAGDFSATSTPIIDPVTGAPFAGNIIPSGRINPVSQSIIDQYMPLPNLQSADPSDPTNYAGSSGGNLTVHQAIVRVDQYFSARDQVFAHYIYAHRDFPVRDLNPNFTFTGNYPIHNVQAQYVHVFSPTFINEFRGGFDFENVAQLSTRTNTGFTIESLGITGLKVGGPSGRPLRADEQGFPILDISGYIGIGDDFAASNLDNSKTIQFVDNVTLIRGKHTIKLGGDVRKLLDDATTNNWPFSNMSFSGDLSGDSAADFMLGDPRTVLTPEGVPITKAREWRFAFYAQDDWKITPRLTLNLGLRYDLFNPPKDINGATHLLLFQPNGAPPQFSDAPDPLWKISHRDFGPRVGFAYSATPSTVVRGGYGIFYFGGQFDNINILQLNPPTAGSLTITNQVLNVVSTIDNPMPLSANPTNTINAVTLPPGNRHPDTYVQNWNLQVARQFGGNDVLEVGYVGNKGTHVDTSFKNWNQPDPGPGDIQSRRPYPTLSRIRMQDYYSNTAYHSLQTRFEHRFSKGLSFTAAYTYSHLIDDSGTTTNDGGCLCQNPRDRTAERASSIFDQRHLLVLGYVWELPFAKNLKGPASTVLSGWSFQGIVTFASGNPFDVLQSTDGQNNDGLWERPNLVPGQKLTVANKRPDNWFNTAAFTESVFEYGNSPRDPIVGPGKHVFDLSLGKSFRMPYNEQHTLQFRAEFFNAFNTPQFANPDSSLGDGEFGRVTNTSTPNRELQFGLKYRF